MKGASELMGFIVGTIGFILLVLGLVYMVIVQVNRRNLYAVEIKEKEYQYQNELLNSQIELQEHLLNEVSKEIHDNVGQILSLVKVHLFTIGNLITDHKASNLVETSSELLDKAIEDLRSISHTKNTGLIQRMGLEETIRKELNYISTLKNHQCNFEIIGNQYSFQPEQELLIFRIAQEAIHNSIKHAKGSLLQVTLYYEPGVFTLTIKDNGTGFNVQEKIASGGLGIQHMMQRAKVLNGNLEINSVISGGAKVVLTLNNEL